MEPSQGEEEEDRDLSAEVKDIMYSDTENVFGDQIDIPKVTNARLIDFYLKSCKFNYEKWKYADEMDHSLRQIKVRYY